jgi:hypothetical protein
MRAERQDLVCVILKCSQTETWNAIYIKNNGDNFNFIILIIFLKNAVKDLLKEN